MDIETPSRDTDVKPLDSLADELYREEVRQARAMPLEQKALLGEILFCRAAEVTLAGIRLQHPEADERQALEILRERIKQREQSEQQENSR